MVYLVLVGEHLLYSGKFDFTNLRYIPVDYYKKMSRGKICNNDVLIVKDGATTGKTAFVSESFPFKEAAVNEHVFIMRVNNKNINSKYLFFWLQSNNGQKCIMDNFQGTAQGGINSNFIKNSNFPLAPLNEQYRIVAKIEELFTNLDVGVESLMKAREQFKQYRQAVLYQAINGDLTKSWRESNKKIKSIDNEIIDLPVLKNKPNISGLHDIPDSWVMVRLDSISKIKKRRYHKRPKESNKKWSNSPLFTSR